MLKTSIVVVQIIALVVALFKYKQFASTCMLTLVGILASSLIIDIWDVIVAKFNIKVDYQYEVWFISSMLTLCLTYFLYYTLIKSKKEKNIILVVSTIFMMVGLASFLKKSLFHIILMLGALNVVVFAVLYFKQLLRSKDVVIYTRVLPFWVTTAFVVLYLPSFLFFFFMMYTHSMSLMQVVEVLIILMNVIIIFGLLWSKKDNSYL